jgi:F0F1-type ATP synthase assembly protein I
LPTDPPSEPPPPQKSGRAGDWTRALREAAPYLGIGSSAAITVLVSLWCGHALDRKLGTRPMLFLIGGVFGIVAAFWQVYKLGGKGVKR